MKEFYTYLQSIGISEPLDTVKIIKDLPFEKVIEVAIKCYELTEAGAIKVEGSSIFNFSASSSVSGGVYPCSDIECRLRNLHELATFAALYADKVIIPNPFEHIYHRITSDFAFGTGEEAYFFMKRVVGDIMVMLKLRPLIENDILTINPQLRTYCEECWKRQLKEQRKIQKVFDKVTNATINDLNKNIEFTLSTKKVLLVKGTKGYIGPEVIRFLSLPKELKPYSKSLPYIFKPNEVKKLGLWEPIVIPIFEDLILQKYSMLSTGAAYLTNRGIEADIIDHLGGETEKVIKDKAFMEGLIHELPFVENASLETLVNFRNKESLAFQAYRDSVRKVIEETKDEKNIEVIKKAVEDKIRPKLSELDRVIKTHKDKFVSSGTEKVIITGLLFTAGLFANKISGIDINSLFGLAGSYKATEIYEAFSEARREPEQVKNSEYYFLWKLKKNVS